MNWVLPLLALTAATALAGDCDDDLNECKEDCLIQFGGSIRLEMKKSYERCMKKCLKTATRCTEAAIEARNVGLDDSAPAPKRAPRDDDEPAAPKKPKKKLAEPRVIEERTTAPKEELHEAEVPRSTRSEVVSDEKPSAAEPPKKVEKAEPPPKANADPPAAVAAPTPAPPPKKEEKPKPAPKKEDDDDLRNY